MGAGRLIDSQSRYVGHHMENGYQTRSIVGVCVFIAEETKISSHGLVKRMSEARIPIAMMMMRGDADGNVEIGPCGRSGPVCVCRK